MKKTLFLQVFAVLAIFSISALANDNQKAWLDAKVVAVGHVSNNGQQIPTATIVLLDPENSNPLARKQVLVVTLQAYSSKTHVSLDVGTLFKAYRGIETARAYGFLVVRFVDDKGHEKSEFHLIMQELSANDVP